MHKISRGRCSITGCNNPGGRAVTTAEPLCEIHYQQKIRAARRGKNPVPQILEYRCTGCNAAVRAQKRVDLVCVKCDQTLLRWR